jgi:three-Cys-motif partner protein
MAPREPIWSLDPHTKAKHELLRHYLGAWFPILSSSGKQRIVFLDGFAGPGIYKGGEPGSPIIALDVLLGHSAFARLGSEFVFLFLEPKRKRYQSLLEQLELLRQRHGGWPANVRIHTSDMTFEVWAESILATLDQQRRSLAPTFAFVDPFGFSGTRLDLLCRLLSFETCEVLFTFMFDYVNRFITEETVSDHLRDLFGTDEYRQAAGLAGEPRKAFLHDLYQRQLHTRCGFTYVKSFEMLGYNGHTGYYLFHGTRSLMGLSRMKDAMWKVDPGGGFRFSDRFAGQDVLFRDDTLDVGPLRTALLERFVGRVATVDDINRFVLVETPYRESHWNRKVMVPLEREGRVQVVASPRKKGYGFPKGTVVRFLA